MIGHCFGMFPNMPNIDYLKEPFSPGISWIFADQMLRVLFNGDAAVTVFFLLSGLVLSIQLSRIGISWRGLLSFYVRRIFRIYPVALAATMLGLLAILVPPVVATQVPVSAVSIIKNLSILANDFDPPLWSLRVEIYLSALFPLIYLAAMRKSTATVMVVAATGLLFATALGHDTTRQAVIAFVLGTALQRYGILRRSLGRVEVAILLASVVGLECARKVIQPLGINMGSYILPETIGAFFIVRSVYVRRPDLRFLDRKEILWLGEISYPFYAVHFPILLACSAGITRAFGTDFVARHAMISASALILAVLTVTLLLAWTVHLLIEMPFQRFGRSLISRWIANTVAPKIGDGIRARS